MSRTKLAQPRAKRPVQSPLDRARGLEVVWQQVADLFDAARRIQDAQFVYFIGEDDNGPIKIGLAKDPINRLRGMQTGNPRRLRLEYVLVGRIALEKLLHELWEPYAIEVPTRKVDTPPGTEWFRGEVRQSLFPIIRTAATHQVRHLAKAEKVVTPEQMERHVRDAHAQHNFQFRGRDEVRLLAATSGYIVRRASRI